MQYGKYFLGTQKTGIYLVREKQWVTEVFQEEILKIYDSVPS